MWSGDMPSPRERPLSNSPSPSASRLHSPSRSKETSSKHTNHQEDNRDREKERDNKDRGGREHRHGHPSRENLQSSGQGSGSSANLPIPLLDVPSDKIDNGTASSGTTSSCSITDKRCCAGVAGAITSLLATGMAWLFFARPSAIQPVTKMMQDLLPGGNLSLPTTVGIPLLNPPSLPPSRWECDYRVEGWALSAQSGILQGGPGVKSSDECRNICTATSECSVWMWYREAGNQPPGLCAQLGCSSFNSSRPCQCNKECHAYNDCCSDAEELCALRPREDRNYNNSSNNSSSSNYNSNSSSSSSNSSNNGSNDSSNGNNKPTLEPTRAQGYCSLMALKQHEVPTATHFAPVVSGSLPCNMVKTVTPGSMFCVAVVVPRSYELELLKLQWKLGASLFACEGFKLYSNESFDAAPGVLTSVVQTTLECKMGGEFGTWLNLDIFIKVWKKLVLDADFLHYDWTVKVDADTVFLPQVLRSLLAHHANALKDADDPAGRGRGLYLTNCELGLHGPIEVLSQRAVSEWVVGVERCQSHFMRLCSGDCLWGEDLFMDQCLSKVLGTRRENEFNLLSEAHCKAPNASVNAGSAGGNNSSDGDGSSGGGEDGGGILGGEEESDSAAAALDAELAAKNGGGYLVLSAEQNWSACNEFRAAFHPFKDVKSYQACLEKAEAFAKRHGLERSVAVPRLQLYQGAADKDGGWADAFGRSGIVEMKGYQPRGTPSLREGQAPGAGAADDGGKRGLWIAAPLFMLIPMLCSFLWSRRSTARCASARPAQPYEWRYRPLSLHYESLDPDEDPL